MQIFRVISNKLARGVVVNVGLWRMVLSDISDLAMTRPEYEWRSFKWLMTKILSLKKRNFVFVDVGASIGRYSLMIAKLFPESLVIAIEPDPDAYASLKAGISINKLGNVVALPLALANIDGTLPLCRRRATTLSSTAECSDVFEVFHVPARRLDTIMRRMSTCVDVLKIDVEGAEIDVILGALNTLYKCRPFIIIEVRDRNKADFLKLMETLRYKCSAIEYENMGCEPTEVN